MAAKNKDQKDNFGFDAAAFAHDVKTPLSVIKGFLGTSGLSEKDMEEYLGAAKRSLEKVIMMVDEMRETPANIRDKFSHRDIAAITCNAMEELKPIAMKQGINVRYAGPENLMCRIDGVSVSRTIANLVLNAIEASKPGDEVLVELSGCDDDVQIKVSDRGTGIDETAIPFVFERGFTTGKPCGSGIGLNVCKETAEQHSGSIDVKSKKGSGTVFTLTLPMFCDKTATSGRVQKYGHFKNTTAPNFKFPSASIFARGQAWFEDTLD